MVPCVIEKDPRSLTMRITPTHLLGLDMPICSPQDIDNLLDNTFI